MPPTLTPEDRTILQQAVRLEICRSCQMRPPGSEYFGAIVERSCERICPMFAQLDGLHRLVRPDRTAKAVQELEARLRQLVCRRCSVCPSGRGDACLSDGTNRPAQSASCPYGAFIRRVVGLMTMNLSTPAIPPDHARPV